MKLLKATFLALLGSTAAIPVPRNHRRTEHCVSRAYVEGVVAKQIIFLQHLPGTEEESRAAALEIFDPNVQEYGDSINSLRGDAVGLCMQ